MAVEVMDDFELEKLRAEIQQEKQMKEMLEQSAAELKATVEELEKRYDTIDNEDLLSSGKQSPSSVSSSDELNWNEWKTRYETQTEINEQLDRQILMLQNKVQEAKANLKDEDLAELGLRPGKGILKRRGVAFTDESSEEGDDKSLDKCIQVDITKSSLTSILKPSPATSADSKNIIRFEIPKETKKTLERTIKIRTKPGSYLPARAHVAGRDSTSRSSVASKAISQSSSESQYSKPNTAATQKSTGLTISVHISPRPGDLAGKSPRDLKNFDDLSDANPHMIRLLEKEKNVLANQMRDMEWRLDQESKADKYMIRSLEKEKQMLQGQIRDIDWRLDQESKAYHKANDERKTYSLEINSTKGSINESSTRTKLSSSRDALDTIPGSRTPRSMGSRISVHETDENSPLSSPRRSKIKTVRNTNYRSLRNLEHEIRNIPEDQRILDPKHGPIKKAAAVKNLPSLETT